MMSTISTLDGHLRTQSAQVVHVYMFLTSDSSGWRSPVSRPYVSTMRPRDSAESHPIDLNDGQTLLQNPHMVQTLTACLTFSRLSALNSLLSDM